jgi:hypothetical protein
VQEAYVTGEALAGDVWRDGELEFVLEVEVEVWVEVSVEGVVVLWDVVIGDVVVAER